MISLDGADGRQRALIIKTLELEADGVFAEVHAFRTRFFVPTGERAARVLQTVTEHRPVVEIRGGDGVSGLRRAA